MLHEFHTNRTQKFISVKSSNKWLCQSVYKFKRVRVADNRSWKANRKALVHAVDPIWRCKKFKEEPLLYHACTNSIKETEGYNSISISVMGFSTFWSRNLLKNSLARKKVWLCSKWPEWKKLWNQRGWYLVYIFTGLRWL